MLDQILTDLDKRRIRVQALEELANRSTHAGERDNAVAMLHRTRNRINAIVADLPTDAGHVLIPARAGFGKVRLHLVCRLILRLDGWLSTTAWDTTFRHGDATLTWTARADRVARIQALVPEFLDDIDQTALAAARDHRAYLRTLPSEDHDSRWQDSLVRDYRKTFMRHYGVAVIDHITLGHRATAVAPVVPGRSPVHDALAAAGADLTRYQLAGPARVIELPPAPARRTA